MPPDTSPDAESEPASTRTHVLGIDADGYLHVYDTVRDRVVVLDEGGIDHAESLEGRPLAHWRQFVSERRGWRRQTDRVTAAELFAGLFS